MSGLLVVSSSFANVEEVIMKDMSCPDSPNCVSSQETSQDHFIEPFDFNDRPEVAMQRLKQALLGEKRVTIVKERADYIHAEARSLIFKFVDDVEFSLLAEQGLIHLRSSSRTGYSDLGVNRRRIERIRTRFQQKK